MFDMTIRTIDYLLNSFGSGKSPNSADYVDLIDTLADDRNAVYFSSTAPADTGANPLWFNTTTSVLSVYSNDSWVSGSAGETGPQGPAGPTGATGPAGAAGGVISLPLYSGYYYRTPNSTEASNTVPAQRNFFSPIYIPKTTTFDRIAMLTHSTFSGTGTYRLGIYNSDSNGQPSTVLLDAGTVTATAASTFYTITINQQLNAGFYWLALNCITAATTNAIKATGNAATINPLLGAFNSSPTFSNGLIQGFQMLNTDATNGFNTASSLVHANAMPYVYIRAA